MRPRSAPSIQMAEGRPGELPLAATYLARGWAVVVTDYQRFGAPDVHTFAVRKPAGHALIDGARAALHLADSGLDAGSPVGFFGYSEGGHAAAAAAELQPEYAPELNLAAVAAGGLAADLVAVARHVEGGFLFVCVPFSVAALKAAYPELPLDHLNDRGRAAVAEVPHLSIEAGAVRYAFLTARDLTDETIDDFFLAQEPWRARVEEQRLGRVAPTAAVFLYHGRHDPFIPYHVATTLRDDWLALGADVQFKTYRFAEHIVPVARALPDIHAFFKARFAGEAGARCRGLPSAQPQRLALRRASSRR
jgi:dienelactone hydrolase